ncbi:polyphosphoinositide phosphatase isoform X2 [Diabrotica virgifera virgifera]|uniref:SAC domain-containing protein n=1 Tax=Diabrotica virgifera virgifera TaxID=50390 RepID=A0ABM5JJJ4_DIAVI|nr:polyphosphoinositide phosphatase isoform X2 [Diabrotica virgifera virgifera]
MDNSRTVFYPIINSIQRMALYETKAKFYLVGSNNTQTRFRVLKIDRTEAKDLEIYDDKVEYTAEEIRNLICMIESGNRRAGGGFSKVISAFGIVGFIKFLEGYYIILITKRRRVALIGHYTIYKIEDTTMVYIPHESVRVVHSDESRYVKMFQNIDLASNFYYSYSYDLTHTLQHNLTNPKRFVATSESEEKEFNLSEKSTDNLSSSIISNSSSSDNGETQNYGVRTQPHNKFVWNMHLLSDAVKAELHPDWVLYIIHGFIDQSNINVFGRSIYVTLIARRSCRYAGTRFLKRGANFQGDVANEVETEQMVHDCSISYFNKSHFTSFVQMRGSIPGHWKQEMGKMVAKPAITIDFYDPFAETAGAHFNELLKRYGAPIIILNLVKQHERKKQERLLSDELSSAIKYLNQFLPVEHQIIYQHFDMARKTKANGNVMGHLAEIAKNAVMKVGIFHNKPKFYNQKGNTVVGQYKNDFGSLQTGIIRTNCVDCLDRTNTAQFAIGKCVLGYQLCALGILDTPNLEFDTDCVRMLESLYEDHGDTLALQYGGSQLVHRIKTYRKTAPWTSQGNDIMQTLSRYYSNTFSDAEKQNAINLFLGLFQPEEGKPQIWDFTSDYYFHHKPILFSLKPLTMWWDGGVLKSLPYAYNDLTKACSELIQVHSQDAEMIDSFVEYYRPYELTMLSDVFALKVPNSIRDFMPNFTTNYSPFTVRVRPVRRREEGNSKTAPMKNPSLTGQSSTCSSTASSTSSSSDEETVDEEESSNTNDSLAASSKESSPEPITFKSLFPSMKEVYGTELKRPNPEDIHMYKKYVLIGKKANGTAKNVFQSITVNQKMLHELSTDSVFQVTPPKVSEASIDIYKKYIEVGKHGGFQPTRSDLLIYERYANYK